MSIDLAAIVGQKLSVSGASLVVGLVYPDGRDCGVPVFVDGYDGPSSLLKEVGCNAQELGQHRPQFEREAEVSIPLAADETVLKGEGFNPRKALG